MLSVDAAGDQVTCRLRIVSGPKPSPPLAPGALYVEGPWKEILPLHRLDEDAGDVLLYTTYGSPASLPAAGDRYVLQCWFNPRQLELVHDTTSTWDRLTLPEELDDEHCALTWQTIDPGVEAYRSDRGDWITVAAYETFIRGDLLRVRGAA